DHSRECAHFGGQLLWWLVILLETHGRKRNCRRPKPAIQIPKRIGYNSRMPDETDAIEPKIQFRIPGPWTSPGELNDALRDASLPWQMHEEALVNIETDRRFDWGVSEHDADIAGLFAHEKRATEEEVHHLAGHKVKVHLQGTGGSVDAARAIIDAATALVSAGGYGVFVDNSGAAHIARDWFKLAGDDRPGGMYWIFVTLAGDSEEIWSVGMHCLGLRDAELPDPSDRQEGAFILHNLLGYTYQSGM